MSDLNKRLKKLEQRLNPEISAKMPISLAVKLMPVENGGSDEPLTAWEEAWCEKYLSPILQEIGDEDEDE